MSRAVRFDKYGPVDVLQVVDVDRPEPATVKCSLRWSAPGSSGEISIREGRLHDLWPATFPSGQGSDFAGRVVEVGQGVDDVTIGEEVIGFTDNRASHADYVVASAEHLTTKPE